MTWSVWPQLLAWYLLGWALRYGALKLAAFASVYSPLWGMLLLPLGVLARLGSYIAMFLVLRRALPGLAVLRTPKELASGFTESRATQVFATAILPFFTFYAAWKFLQEDYVQYMRWALDVRTAAIWEQTAAAVDANSSVPIDFGPGPADISPTTFVLCVIGVAFLARFLIKRFSDRLPRWTGAFAVYFEALWVFLAAKQMAPILFDFPGWLESRQIVVSIDQVRADLMSPFEPLEVAWTAITSAVSELSGVIVLPIAWLGLAGIIYARALAISEERRRQLFLGPRARRIQDQRAALGQRWSRVHPVVRDRTSELIDDIVGRFKPLADAGRLIVHAGLLPMSLYVLAYTLLLGAPGWLFMGIAHVLGPHPLTFWFTIDQSIGFVTSAIVEPLRICLIAAAYDFCLEQLAQHRRDEADRDAAAPTAGPTAGPAAGAIGTA
jgi:hypothetical protein